MVLSLLSVVFRDAL